MEIENKRGGMTIFAENISLQEIIAMAKDMGMENNEPYRKQTLQITYSELLEYRQAKTYGAIMALDRLFFERHCTAIAFTRPAFYGEGAILAPGQSGCVYVRRVNDSQRIRYLVFDNLES